VRSDTRLPWSHAATPVVYLYLDSLQAWLSGRKPAAVREDAELIEVQAAERGRVDSAPS
jgi:hypothetical protein